MSTLILENLYRIIELTENQRLKVIMDTLGFKTQTAFAKVLGIQQGSLSDILRGKSGVGVSGSIKHTLEILYNVNREWLETGKGEMINKTGLHVASMGGEDFEQKTKDVDPDTGILESTAPDKPTYIKLDEDLYEMEVPLIKDISAGYGLGLTDPDYFDKFPKHKVVVDQIGHARYFAFRVKGDSMAIYTESGHVAGIPEGAIVTGREIDRYHWRSRFHMKKWKYFIVITKTDREDVVKEIVGHDIVKGTITIHSLNPKYKDEEIYLNDCIQILNVVDVHIKPNMLG